MTHRAPHFRMGRSIFLVTALAVCVGGNRTQVSEAVRSIGPMHRVIVRNGPRSCP